MENSNKLFTIGEFASKSGVTLRTLRYYDKINLLKPCDYTESGHRLYSSQDFAKLQKILTLKFIGLSLDEISKIIKNDTTHEDFINSLGIQKEIIEQKIHHMQMVSGAIDEALVAIDDDKILNWNKFINIIRVINLNTKWLEQYENASNLRARINIHELYSTNKQGWMNWFFEELNIPENSKILEVGCGDGSLWNKNFYRIPEKWEVTLTDFSSGMLKDAYNNLGPIKSRRFKFLEANIESLPFEDKSFDVVIANHMLYHVSDIEKALSEVYRVLKPGGTFYASTVGKNHMKEMRDIVNKFDNNKSVSKYLNLTEKFQLENGVNYLNKYFKNITIKRYEDSLLITSSNAIVDYIFSMPGDMKKLFHKDNLNKLIELLESKISKDGKIYITKDTGFFKSKVI